MAHTSPSTQHRLFHATKQGVRTLVAWLCLAVIVMTSPLAAAKSTIRLINLNAANQGLNDTTAATPVGGNTGTTLGEQRRIALQYTADLLSIILHSDVPIDIGVSFSNLGGDAQSAPLALSGPNTYHYDFAGALSEKTWYAQPLANKLFGQDLATTESCNQASKPQFLCFDVLAEFNSSIDTATILTGSSWYYGLDAPSQTDPEVTDKFDLVTVTLHEWLHGMGIISLVDASTGAFFYSSVENEALPDRYSALLSQTSASPSNFADMTAAQRAQALKANGDNNDQSNVVWNGSAGNTLANEASRGSYNSKALIYAPDPVESGASLSHVDTSFIPNQTMEPFYTEATHSIGVGAGMLADMGWGSLANLSVSMASGANPSPINQTTTYQFAVSNKGPESATDVTFVYTLPTGSSLQSASPTTCTTQGSSISCPLGTLTSGAGTIVQLTLIHTTTGTLSHVAEVYGDIVDAAPGNNVLETQTTVANITPNVLANAGEDLKGTSGGSVTLNATGSSIISGSISDYSFEQVNGDTTLIQETSEGQATVTLPDKGDDVIIKVQVTDSSGNSSSDFVIIAVNKKPTASAGSDANVNLNQNVTLSGSGSTDPDGSIATYLWQQISGTTVTLSNAASQSPSFTAPSEPDTLNFTLTVTDNEGASATDTVTISVAQASNSSSGGPLNLPTIGWLALIAIWLARVGNGRVNPSV